MDRLLEKTEYEKYIFTKAQKERFIEEYNAKGAGVFTSWLVSWADIETAVFKHFVEEFVLVIYDKVIAEYDAKLAEYKQGAIAELRALENEGCEAA